MTATVWARFDRVGFHYWPGARGKRHYLADRHRHTFSVTVAVPVEDDDREVEFHDLRDLAERWWPHDGELGPRSCETIGREIADWIALALPGRWIEVDVSEDNEAGATIRREPQ